MRGPMARGCAQTLDLSAVGNESFPSNLAALRRMAGFSLCVALLAVGCRVTPRAEVARLLARVKGRVGVAVKDTPDQDSWDIRGDEPFVAGESVGLFVLAELFRQIETGKLKLDQPVALAEGIRPQHLAILTSVNEVSLRDLAVLMLAEGDTVATNVLIDRLGLDNINCNAQTLGSGRTVIKRKLGFSAPPENYTTANDLAATWVELTQGESLSTEARAELQEMLRVSRVGRQSPAGLPAADVRTYYDGDSPGRGAIVHGSGVLYLPGRHVALVIVGEGLESARSGEETIARVSKIIHARYEEDCRHVDR